MSMQVEEFKEKVEIKVVAPKPSKPKKEAASKPPKKPAAEPQPDEPVSKPVKKKKPTAEVRR